MTTINLRDFYPWYTHDEFIEIPDEVNAELLADKRYHQSHRRRMYRNKSHYSFDCGDGIENDAIYPELTPEQIYEYQVTMQQLCNALNSLPESQGRRIDAHYILGMKKVEIGLAEGVCSSCVCSSIKTGLRNMRKYLQNHL